jgi:hypothetical protein
MQKSGGDKEMDTRVGRLEQSVAVLQTTQDGMKQTLDKVASGLDLLLQQQSEMRAQQSEIRAQKPFSVRESLSTILTTLGIFTIIISALTWKIDTQASVKAEPAIKVTEMIMKDGDYFLLKARVAQLEQALAWKPVLVSTEVASRH